MLSLLADAYFLREEHFLADYLREVVVMPDLEGDRAKEELVTQYAYTPYINLAIVVLGLDHFRWSV